MQHWVALCFIWCSVSWGCRQISLYPEDADWPQFVLWTCRQITVCTLMMQTDHSLYPEDAHRPQFVPWWCRQITVHTLRMQTDSMTSLTPAGGFCIVLTMVMSFCFRVSRAARAASMAGIATASLASQSSCHTHKLQWHTHMNTCTHRDRDWLIALSPANHNDYLRTE